MARKKIYLDGERPARGGESKYDERRNTRLHALENVPRPDVCARVVVLHADGSGLMQLSLILAKGASTPLEIDTRA